LGLEHTVHAEIVWVRACPLYRVGRRAVIRAGRERPKSLQLQ